MAAEEREQKLRKIKEEIIECQKCSLYKKRIEDNVCPVIGEGSHQAKIMFVGEAPGAQEAKTGRPFCGASGKILTELLESAGIKREDVYITNLLKDRPPKNRDPEPEEIEVCSSYLERQIDIIKPEIICPLGRHSMSFFMNKFNIKSENQLISRIHGKVFKAGNIKIIPLYHPAASIYNPNMKDVLKKDIKVLKEI